MNFNFLPFAGFLFFCYVGATMGAPDRLPWERPANATKPGDLPIPPMCIGDREPGTPDAWQPCTHEELAQNDPMIFDVITGEWK